MASSVYCTYNTTLDLGGWKFTINKSHALWDWGLSMVNFLQPQDWVVIYLVAMVYTYMYSTINCLTNS